MELRKQSMQFDYNFKKSTLTVKTLEEHYSPEDPGVVQVNKTKDDYMFPLDSEGNESESSKLQKKALLAQFKTFINYNEE